MQTGRESEAFGDLQKGFFVLVMENERRQRERYRERSNEKLAGKHSGRSLRALQERRQRGKQRLALLGAALLAAGGILAAKAMLNRSGIEEAGGEWALFQRVYDPGATENLMLVNLEHPVPENYEVQLHWLQNGKCAVAEEMYDSLKAMLTDGSEDGCEFVVASGYRDAQTQDALLQEDIERAMAEQGLSYQEAYNQEARETMPAGYSEHQTGLAVDLVSVGYQILDAGQEQTMENIWLRENCSRYGFILRYPPGTGEITGINYEPWHFRYVGEKAAREIMRRGITLEEYLGEA